LAFVDHPIVALYQPELKWGGTALLDPCWIQPWAGYGLANQGAKTSNPCIFDDFCKPLLGMAIVIFFYTTTGASVDLVHLRRRVWTPVLSRAGLQYREMKQTRHRFATIALSCGENPLWFARVMGYRNTEMIIRVYSGSI
jgi:hypothetical protein